MKAIDTVLEASLLILAMLLLFLPEARTESMKFAMNALFVVVFLRLIYRDRKLALWRKTMPEIYTAIRKQPRMRMTLLNGAAMVLALVASFVAVH